MIVKKWTTWEERHRFVKEEEANGQTMLSDSNNDMIFDTVVINS